MRPIVRFSLVLSCSILSSCIARAYVAPTDPTPLQITHSYNVTSAAQVLDNRSVTRQCNMFTYNVTSGTGNWSVQLEYSDLAATGPWTIFPLGALVNTTSPSDIGFGIGYHNWVRLNTTSGTTSANLSCEKDFYLPAGSGGGGSNGITQLTGDVSAIGPGSVPATLATVNTTPGTCGDSSNVCQITTNIKGLVTSQTAVPISGGANGITSLTGDATATGPGAAATTLATVNTSPGTYGGSSSVPVVTVNGKGLVTNVTTSAIPTQNYGTVQANGVAQTQRANLNVAAGSNVTVTPSDNGTDTTTLTISSTGGGGGGAGVATQLLDLAPGTGSGSSIPFGANCNASTPCYVQIGGGRFSFTNTATLNITGGTGNDAIFFYVDNFGNRTMGYSSITNTYTCTNCENAPASGISAFPAGSFPLYQCPVTAGVLSSSACVDKRPILSMSPIQGNLGIGIVPSGNSAAINLAETVDSQTGTSYIVPNSDCGGLITFNNANPVAVQIPQAGLGGQFISGCVIEVRNYGAGTVTITPASGSIGGQPNLQVTQAQGQRIISDGSNYQLGTGGQAGGSFLPTTGGTMTGGLTINASTTPLLSLVNSAGSFANMFFQSGGSTPSTQWSVFANPVSLNTFGINDRTDNVGEIVINAHTLSDPDTVTISKGKLNLGTLITPTSSLAACVTGTINIDTGFLYVCTATNNWKRVALSTF